MPAKWTESETLQCVLLYQHMLNLERSNKLGPKRSAGQTSKKKLVRDFMTDHSPEGRTHGSVEMKLMNITAAREELGLPTIAGYKPLPNGAGLLKDLIGEANNG